MKMVVKDKVVAFFATLMIVESFIEWFCGFKIHPMANVLQGLIFLAIVVDIKVSHIKQKSGV